MEPTCVKHLSSAPLKGRLLGLASNIRLAWKGLPRANTNLLQKYVNYGRIKFYRIRPNTVLMIGHQVPFLRFVCFGQVSFGKTFFGQKTCGAELLQFISKKFLKLTIKSLKFNEFSWFKSSLLRIIHLRIYKHYN
jgi:hypothetical protein